MRQETGQANGKRQFEITSQSRYFSYKDNSGNEFPSPWKAAFPDSNPLGYWEVFAKRCSLISNNGGGVVDEETAKMIWMSILSEYEDYQRMGMWLPEQVIGEHRQVAIALGWHEEQSKPK